MHSALSEVVELVLVLADELDLLIRHLVLCVLLHNTVAHGRWLEQRSAFRGLLVLLWVDQKAAFLTLLLLAGLWLVLGFDLAVVEGVPVDIGEEGMRLDLFSVAVRTES